MAGRESENRPSSETGRNAIIVRENPLDGRRNRIENERSGPQAERKHQIDIVVAAPTHTEKMTIGRVNGTLR